MTNEILLNEISIRSSTIGNELKKIKTHSILAPEMAVSKARSTLELIVNEIEHAHGDSLFERIQTLSEKSPDSIITYMHFIRKLGNLAIHSQEKISMQIANDVYSAITNIVCWHLQIDQNARLGINARYFIADAIYRTWSKVLVLTENGVLYSEYLTYMKPTKFIKNEIDFYKFKASDYSFGENEHGHAYQTIREVSHNEASSFQLLSQINWVNRYLKDVGVKIG